MRFTLIRVLIHTTFLTLIRSHLFYHHKLYMINWSDSSTGCTHQYKIELAAWLISLIPLLGCFWSTREFLCTFRQFLLQSDPPLRTILRTTGRRGCQQGWIDYRGHRVGRCCHRVPLKPCSDLRAVSLDSQGFCFWILSIYRIIRRF